MVLEQSIKKALSVFTNLRTFKILLKNNTFFIQAYPVSQMTELAFIHKCSKT
jgi:hypothetical protein